MPSEEQYYLGNGLLGWDPDQGVLWSLQVLWSPSCFLFLRKTKNDWIFLFISIYLHSPFLSLPFIITRVMKEMAFLIRVWCVLVSGVFVVDLAPLIPRCRFMHRVARFSFLLALTCFWVLWSVLSNGTCCDVSPLCIWPAHGGSSLPHVASVIEETFLRYISCTLTLMHLHFRVLRLWNCTTVTTV